MRRRLNHNDIKVYISSDDSLFVEIKGQTIYIDTSMSDKLIVNSWNNKKVLKSDCDEIDWSIVQQLDKDRLVLTTEIEREVK
jgi:hypothetical protein